MCKIYKEGIFEQVIKFAFASTEISKPKVNNKNLSDVFVDEKLEPNPLPLVKTENSDIAGLSTVNDVNSSASLTPPCPTHCADLKNNSKKSYIMRTLYWTIKNFENDTLEDTVN